MFTKWFGSRSSRLPQRDRFFRPQLEDLEGRLAPSSLVPMDHGNGNGGDHGHGNGNGSGNGSGNGIGNINQTGNVHNNIHITNSFNNATDSFNNVVSLAGAGLFSAPQMGSLGELFITSYLLSAQMSNNSLGLLINDEIALAVDNYLLNQPAITAVPGLSAALTANVNALNSAIAPLEGNVIGQLVGTVAYDVTYFALQSAQPTL